MAGSATETPRAEGVLAPLTVLLAEDDDDLRSLVATLLRRDGHMVIEARDGSDLMADLACAYLTGSECADEPLVVTDLRLPVADSLSVIRAIRSQGRRPPFILMTAFGDSDIHAEAVRLGALAVLDKPFDVDRLRNAVRQFARSRGAS
jgi:DNA-binding NtrC family response regulator